MKIVDFDKLSVLNLHYCQYTLDYFLDCMQELGIKNVNCWEDIKDFGWIQMNIRIQSQSVKNYRNTV